jgi:hypothetical protein
MPKVSDAYNKLYHYTTWEGLIGILDSQSLWATNYRFVNDCSELVLFRDKLISVVHPYASETVKMIIHQFPHVNDIVNEKGGIEEVIHHEAKALVDAQYSALGNEIYILSFCGQHSSRKINDNGLLSQWRGYGSGGGAAVVFDTKKLEEILDFETSRFEYSVIYLADIVYSDDDRKFREELSQDLSVIADVMKQFFDFDTFCNRKFVDASKAFHPFVRCISRYKHYGFSEENEVRVIALPTVIDDELERRANADGVRLRPEKDVKFHKRNGQNVPYIDLFDSSDIQLPIDKIIIGPHVEKEARAEVIRAKLSNTDIEITCSDIPYVCFSAASKCDT